MPSLLKKKLSEWTEFQLHLTKFTTTSMSIAQMTNAEIDLRTEMVNPSIKFSFNNHNFNFVDPEEVHECKENEVYHIANKTDHARLGCKSGEI